MFEKASKLPLFIRIILTIVLSIIWILMISNFDLDIKTNWIVSTIGIAGISSIFFPFRRKKESEKK